MNFKITLQSGETTALSCFMGFFGETLSAESLEEALKKENMDTTRIVAMDISAETLEIQWGSQFRSCENLEQVSLRAGKLLKLNCYNFKDSHVRQVSLSAPEIWFNDGVFADAPELNQVHIYGRILDGQHRGLSEMLFMNCKNLTHVSGFYHGDSLMPGVFSNCPRLITPLDFRVRKLGYRTFSGCASLRKLHLHNGLKDLGYAAFENCTALEDIYIPDTVENLGTDTFSGCTGLKSIHLPDGISCIPDGFLRDCASLRKCFIPDSVTTIGAGAFEGCSLMLSPYFPEQLREIRSRAFCGCTSIQTVLIPESVQTIAEDAFERCPQLVIKGKRGSAAEIYAQDHQIPFQDVFGAEARPQTEPEYDLQRFISAHRQDYATALREIKNGRKVSHWMWYIFPQMKGLGKYATSQLYGIGSLEEAAAYLADPYLGGHMYEICDALLQLDTGNAHAVFGSPDNLKLRSSMTLFALVAGDDSVFQKVLDKYYGGRRDGKTLQLLNR